MLRHFSVLPLLIASLGIHAADSAPEPAKIEAAKPDPTAAIVGEGHQVYRQRDIDALVLIADRHRKGKLSGADEDQLRQALARILVAREPLLEALDALPPGLASGKARDALLLDILDYQAEAVKAQPTRPAEPAKPAAEPTKPGTEAAKPAAEPARPADAKPEAGPVIVSLPPLTQTRTLDKLGKRQLSVQIALLFPDAAVAKRFEERAPIIRDAILGFVHQLPPAEFNEPDQVALKRGIQAAITAKLPDFPKDGVLIPQLESGPPDAKDEK